MMEVNLDDFDFSDSEQLEIQNAELTAKLDRLKEIFMRFYPSVVPPEDNLLCEDEVIFIYYEIRKNARILFDEVAKILSINFEEN